MHARIAERIARTAHTPLGTTILEIGPGTGKLTRELLKIGEKVVAVEADRELFEMLQKEFSDEVKKRGLELSCADIRTFDLTALPKGYALVANIPYYLTGDILRTFLESENQPSSMTLLVQKEVAERVARSKKESILSLSIKAYGVPTYEFTVPRGAFIPPPKVDSAVITIRDISRSNFASRTEEQRYFALVRAGFSHKRKFLKNNLKDAGFSTDSLPEKVRAEDLSLADWLALAKT